MSIWNDNTETYSSYALYDSDSEMSSLDDYNYLK